MTTVDIRTAPASIAGLICAAAGTGLALITFLAMWGPTYITGSQSQLFLYPLFMLLGFGAVLLGLAAVVVTSVSLVEPAARSARAWAVIGWGSAITVATFPVLWFGNLPIALLP